MTGHDYNDALLMFVLEVMYEKVELINNKLDKDFSNMFKTHI